MKKENIEFIAEVSSNHNQSLERSLHFIDISAQVGCSSVKFQLFRINELFSKEILKKSKKHRERVKWELPLDFVPALSSHAHEKGLNFSCTPFYLDAVSELEPFVDFYKIASYELLWDDLLIECAKTKKDVIISTGMANINEIKHAVEVLKSNGCDNLTLLHCTSAYPTPYKEANLSAIKTMRDDLGCSIGWSDHTVNPGVIYRAIHRWGAKVIEFHLDIDSKGEEFSSGHCWLPKQIKRVIQNCNDGIESDGDGIKQPSLSEIPDRDWRADPSDGLRPLIQIRKIWEP